MKTFIVSLALTLMGITALIFSWDLSCYQQMGAHLKAASESSALCGAVSLSQNEDYEESVQAFVAKIEVDSSLFSNGRLQVNECSCDENKVIVTLQYEPDNDFFRLAGIGTAAGSSGILTHTSCYAYEEIE